MKVKILIFFLIINFLGLIFIKASLAAFPPNGSGGSDGLSGIDKVRSEILKILSNIIRFLFAILMLIGGGLLIFLGVKYISGRGDVKELHRSLLYLILGISLLILSFFIPNIIKNFIEQSIK